MAKKLLFLHLALIIFVSFNQLTAQTMSASNTSAITYEEFMQTVAKKNVSLLAEQYNIDIATANVSAAKVFNDPDFEFTYGNNENWHKAMGYGCETTISYELDIAGVRSARIKTAKSERDITEVSVRAFLNNLRCEASMAWAETWRLKHNCKVIEAAVAKADSSSITELMELKSTLIETQCDYKNALAELSFMCGGEAITDIADHNLPESILSAKADELCLIAVRNRADLKAAELGKTLSENNLRLVKANRRPEITLGIGYTYNSEVHNEIAPAPKFNGIVFSIGVPLKFSSFNKGERRAAEYQVQQSHKQYEAAVLMVQKETIQAYNKYIAAQQLMQQYNDDNLCNMEMQINYNAARSNLFSCYAQLQHAIGY